jgi:TolB protein
MKRTKLIKILLGAALPALLAFGTIHSATAQTRIVFQAGVTVTVNKHTSTSYSQIFSMNPDGSDPVQLTSANASAYAPSWSPGQKYIAFSRNQTLYVMEAIGEANGGRTFAVAPAFYCGGADWSPDGTMLVYEGPDSHLYIVPVNADAGTVGTPVLFRSGSYSDPSWSPDGSRIAFWGCDHGNPPYFLKVRDVQTGAEISFVGLSGSCYDPKWSPDGTLIAFTGYVVAGTVTTKKGTSTTYASEIFTANANGTGIMRQTYLKSYTFFPTWSPDGTTIAFRSDVSGIQSVYKMVLGSNVAPTLLHSPGNAPDWNPSAPLWP